MIRLENLTQRFRVIHEQADIMREVFTNFLRRRVAYHDIDGGQESFARRAAGPNARLIGRNGSGKSTPPKLIAGVYRPNTGRPGSKAASLRSFSWKQNFTTT